MLLVICCSFFLALLKKWNVLPCDVLEIKAIVSAVMELAHYFVTSYSGLPM